MRIGELCESIDIHPGVKNDRDGEIYIDYPPDSVKKVKRECSYCEGTGRDIQWEVHPRRRREPDYIEPCEMCDGTGTRVETDYIFPNLNVSNMTMSTICDLLGIDGDQTGWIEKQDIPAFRRRLISIKNGDLSPYTEEPSEERSVHVDRSGPIPRISSGATMIGGGRDEARIMMFVDRLLMIFEWAQKHDCGVSWA
jgi:hypothetical protein